MVDRDALAGVFDRQNAELNGVPDVEVYGTLGYEDVRGQDFDLIMSNIPGKAGESLVKHILLGGVNHLRPGGLVAVVVVSPLARTVLGLLDEAPHVEVVFQKATPSYTVFHYRFTADNDESPRTTWDSVTRGVYRRKTINVQLGEVRYSAETAYGLPEFDSPSFQSRLLVDALNPDRLSQCRGRSGRDQSRNGSRRSRNGLGIAQDCAKRTL